MLKVKPKHINMRCYFIVQIIAYDYCIQVKMLYGRAWGGVGPMVRATNSFGCNFKPGPVPIRHHIATS